MFTVDMPVPGMRRWMRIVASGVQGAECGDSCRRGRPGWGWDVGVRGRPHILGNVAPVLGKTSGLEDFVGCRREFRSCRPVARPEWTRARPGDGP